MHPGDPGVNNGMAVEILKMAGVTKRFPGVLALNNVNFTLQEGETHALVGANGAGKSTLIKTLAGVYPPDSGTIELRGEKQVFKDQSMPNKKALRSFIRNLPFSRIWMSPRTFILAWSPFTAKRGL